MTFEDLKRVNEGVNRIELKGKFYACVAARVQAFRELYPCGLIETEILGLADGVVTMRATVYDEEGKKLAVGHAQEKEGSSNVNKTSYIENCETSAVGRALGMLGIGSDEQMASAEEMVNALKGQGAPGASRDEMIAALNEYYSDPAKKKNAIDWIIGNLYKPEDKASVKREITDFLYIKQYALEAAYKKTMERMDGDNSEGPKD